LALDIVSLKADNNLLFRIIDYAHRLLGEDDSVLFLFDAKQQELELVVGSQPSAQSYLGIRLQLGEGVAGKVAQTLQPMIVNDYANWSGKSPKFKNAAHQNLMAVPLLYEGELYGVLVVSDLERQRAFSESDLRSLIVFSELAALTLANALLHKHTEMSEARFRALTDNALVGIYAVQDKKIAFANEQFANLFGYELNDLIGRPVNDIIAPQDRAMMERKSKERFEQKIPADHYMFKGLKRDGSVMQCELFASLIQLNDAPAAQGMIVDVSERHHNQQLLNQLIALGANILSETDISTILQRVCDTLIQHSQFQTAAMIVFERPVTLEKTVNIDTFYIAGVNESERQALLANQAQKGILQNTDIMNNGRPIGSGFLLTPEDLPQMTDFSITLSHYPDTTETPWGLYDNFYLFLKQGDLLAGRISLSAPRNLQIPTEAQVEPLELLTNFAALAIKNARQARSLKAQSDRLNQIYRFGQELTQIHDEQSLFTHVLRGLRQDFAYDICTILLLKGDFLELAAKDTQGVDHNIPVGTQFPAYEGITGWVAAHHTPRNCSDVRKADDYQEIISDTRSELCVPILLESTLLGVLNIESTQVNAFDNEDVQLLSMIAAQLALAFSNLERYRTLKEQATRDALTGLYNRHHFNEIMDQEFQRAARYKHPIGILFVDIDNMHGINSTHGHLKGDVLLQGVAQLLTKTVRASDWIFRYGGDELLILLPETNGEANILVERLQAAQDLWNQDHPDLTMSLSIGVTCWLPDSKQLLEDLIQEASVKMFRQKRSK